MCIRALCFFLLFVVTASSAVAQKAPIKWGDIPDDELRMTEYPADSNAAAVILADYASIYHEHSGELVMERHRRIKILSEGGFSHGTVELQYWSEKRRARIRGVRGQTFNVLEDGRVERVKLGRKSVFQQDLGDGYYQTSFTLPKLKAGSVIEYSYTQVFEHSHLIPDWYFQNEEPTLLSELRVQIPHVFEYITLKTGFAAAEEATYESSQRDGAFGAALLHRWVMTDVPALREEPHMTTLSDFRRSIRFQPSAFRSGVRVEQFLTTWEDMAKRLFEHNLFGRQLGRHKDIRALAHQLTFGMDDDQKLEAVYQYVSRNIEWDGKLGGYVPDQKLTEVLQKKSGTVAEINLLLLALLQDAGLEADPVLISTRSHGAVLEQYPIAAQFNSLIVRAMIGKTEYLLDASSPQRPMGLLPPRALNQRGWLVRAKNPRWIDLEARGSFKRNVNVEAELREDGTVVGTAHVFDFDYSAVSQRDFLRDNDLETYFRKRVFEDIGDVVLQNLRVENQDEIAKPLGAHADFELPAYAMAAGDMIYMNAHIIERTETNPLRLPERTFPVNMTYPSESLYTLRLKLPTGYSLLDHPPSAGYVTPGRGAFFTREVTQAGELLVVQNRFKIDQVVFEPSEYHAIRQLFAHVVAMHNEQIVLTRSQPVQIVPAEEEVAPVGGDR